MTAATIWSAGASLSLNTVVASTTTQNGMLFRVTQAGTTGSSEPEWAKSVGVTVYDNNVRYISFSSTFSEISKINPSAIVELYELHLDSAIHGSNTVYRFHNGSSLNANGKITWKGNEYFRFPIEADGFAYQRGQLPRPTLTISNLFSTPNISAILLAVNQTTTGNDLTGAKFVRIRTLVKFIDHINFPVRSVITGTENVQAVDPSDIETITYTVTVVADSNGDNVFAINGVQKPFLTMKRGSTYIFDQSHSSNSGHPLRIKSDTSGLQPIWGEVTGSAGQAGYQITYKPEYPDAPNDLRYVCEVHGNAMGREITMNNPNTITVTQNVVSLQQTNPFGTPDPSAEFPQEIYFIDRKTNDNREVVSWELSAVFDLMGIRAPKRQCTRRLFPAVGTFKQ